VFSPAIGILVESLFVAFEYSCCLRLGNEELFCFLRSRFIVIVFVLYYLVECCRKRVGRGVRLPFNCALIVFSNTISLDPMVFFVIDGVLTCFVTFVFRWRSVVAGRWWGGRGKVGWVGGGRRVCSGRFG
jgi:hypothetical protein